MLCLIITVQDQHSHDFVPHLTRVFPAVARASTDHVICDPEVVGVVVGVVPAVPKDLHIHSPQYRWQFVSVEPGHTPAADSAPGTVGQGRGVRVWQRGRMDPGVKDSSFRQLDPQRTHQSTQSKSWRYHCTFCIHIQMLVMRVIALLLCCLCYWLIKCT